MIFLNRTGDNTKSPEWATDGSYLAFREIEENVHEFNKYGLLWFPPYERVELMWSYRFVKEESKKLESFDDGTGDKLAAYMIGRWKNGRHGPGPRHGGRRS